MNSVVSRIRRGSFLSMKGHASIVSKNVHSLCATGVFRLDRTIAGDRPPRYGRTEDIAPRNVGRGPVSRHA